MQFTKRTEGGKGGAAADDGRLRMAAMKAAKAELGAAGWRELGAAEQKARVSAKMDELRKAAAPP